MPTSVFLSLKANLFYNIRHN